MIASQSGRIVRCYAKTPHDLIYLSSLSWNEKGFLEVLISQSHQSFSYSDLARMLHVSRSTVARVIKKLTREGLIIYRKGGLVSGPGSGYIKNKYIINFKHQSFKESTMPVKPKDKSLDAPQSLKLNLKETRNTKYSSTTSEAPPPRTPPDPVGAIEELKGDGLRENKLSEVKESVQRSWIGMAKAKGRDIEWLKYELTESAIYADTRRYRQMSRFFTNQLRMKLSKLGNIVDMKQAQEKKANREQGEALFSKVVARGRYGHGTEEVKFSDLEAEVLDRLPGKNYAILECRADQKKFMIYQLGDLFAEVAKNTTNGVKTAVDTTNGVNSPPPLEGAVSGEEASSFFQDLLSGLNG